MTEALEPVTDRVWLRREPLSMWGMRFGAGMSVVRLESGGVLLYSPVAPSEEVTSAVDALGPVTSIVAPNLYHHLSAAKWKERHPDAVLLGAPGLAKKRPDVPFDGFLDEAVAPDWGDEVAVHPIDGMNRMQEHLVLHRPSGTLLTADLLSYFARPVGHWLTDAYFRLERMIGQPRFSPALRLTFTDRGLGRQSLEALLEQPFDRIVPCHGNAIVEADAREVMREAHRWLLR